MSAIERNDETGRINALPEEIVLDPTRDAERAWRAEAAPLYDELTREQRVLWACGCSEHVYPHVKGKAGSSSFNKLLGSAQSGSENLHGDVAWILKNFGADVAGWAQLLGALVHEDGCFLRPGIGVAHWCQVLSDDADAEREWQMEQLCELKGVS